MSVIDEIKKIDESHKRHKEILKSIEESRIVQIISVEGWKAQYKGEDGCFSSPVIAWALTKSGLIAGLSISQGGYINKCDTAHNFMGYLAPGEDLIDDPDLDEI